MHTRIPLRLPLSLLLAGWLVGCAGAPLMHRGGIQVDRWAEVHADDKSVAAILAAFNRAEAAMRAGDLDGVMKLYSRDYRYHGLTKNDLRRIWADLLARHERLSSNHIFSRIVVTASGTPTADITCFGSLWGISKETGQRVNIDSWYGEVHHLVFEDGAWRVRGHAHGEAASKSMEFGVAPHPFF